MLIRRLVITLASILISCRLAGAADPRQTWDQPTKKWIKGPVQCLVTPEEMKQWKTLKTDEEIAQFVKDFWARRDPTPGTPANEFADLFWKRVEEADRQFQQTTDPGAMSDRGQIYLLLGRATKYPSSGKTIDWVYENLPNVTPNTFMVQFSLGQGNPLLLGRKGVEQIIDANEFLRGLGPKAAAIYAPKPAVAQLPAASEAQAPAVATAEAKILDDNALNDSLPSDIPVSARLDYYEATKGDTFVVLTLSAPKKQGDPAQLVGFARLIPYSSEKPLTLAAADSFSPADPENSEASASYLVYQGATGAHPGKYSLLAGLRDPASGKVGLLRQPIEIPNYSSGPLQISTVILATELKGPAAPPALGEGKRAPFYLGSFRIVPSMDSVFHQGSNLAWYYQIYNAAPDPATGKPNLTLEYNFLLKQQDPASKEWQYRSVLKDGKPQVTTNRSSQVEAFSFQLIKPVAGKPGSGWVAGDYEITLKISDVVGNASVAQTLPFTIVP